MLKGKFGPYVSDGETNATLPEGTEPDGVTMEQALALIAERAAKGGKKKKPAKAAKAPKAKAEKSAAKKPAAAAAKKPAAKAKTTSTKKKAAKPVAKTTAKPQGKSKAPVPEMAGE